MKMYYQNYDPENPTEEMKYPYRWKKNLKVKKNGIKNTRGKHMNEFSGFYMTMKSIAHPRAFVAMMNFLLKMTNLFFFPQHFQRMHILHRPIKHVDHSLDEKVPFRTDKLSIYMTFIRMWMQPLSMIFHRYSYNSAASIAIEWYNYLAMTYPEANKLYKYTMTTTYRPKTDDKSFKRLRRTDPHYECVPSLHISTVTLAFCFYRMIFEREDFTQEEKDMWNADIFLNSSLIGESVLYVKQHSVNCVPAGLYMLYKIAPELCTKKEVYEFIDSFFQNETDISEEDKQAVILHIKNTFDKFVEEGKDDVDWSIPVKKWLDNYEHYTPSYAD